MYRPGGDNAKEKRLRGAERIFLAEEAASITVGAERLRPVGLEQSEWEKRGRKGRWEGNRVPGLGGVGALVIPCE